MKESCGYLLAFRQCMTCYPILLLSFMFIFVVGFSLISGAAATFSKSINRFTAPRNKRDSNRYNLIFHRRKFFLELNFQSFFQTAIKLQMDFYKIRASASGFLEAKWMSLYIFRLLPPEGVRLENSETVIQ